MRNGSLYPGCLQVVQEDSSVQEELFAAKAEM